MDEKQLATTKEKENASIEQQERVSEEDSVLKMSTRLANPLAGMSEEELLDDAGAFAERAGLSDQGTFCTRYDYDPTTDACIQS